MNDKLPEFIDFIWLWYKSGRFVFGTPDSEAIKNALRGTKAIDGTAKWVFKKQICSGSFSCSNCNNQELIPTNFCSECGRKMVAIEMEDQSES